jgi:hypothetical protein
MGCETGQRNAFANYAELEIAELFSDWDWEVCFSAQYSVDRHKSKLNFDHQR